MNINITKIITELRAQFGNTTELIFFQSDSIIQVRIKVFSSGKEGFHNYAFNLSEEEITQGKVNIFDIKFNHAIKELKIHIAKNIRYKI